MLGNSVSWAETAARQVHVVDEGVATTKTVLVKMRRLRIRALWAGLPTSLALLVVSLGTGNLADAWVWPAASCRAATVGPGSSAGGGARSLAAATMRIGGATGREGIFEGGSLLRSSYSPAFLRRGSAATTSAIGRWARLPGDLRMAGGDGFVVQTVDSEDEVRGLALLCLESFYGKQKPVDYLNPIGALQRSLVIIPPLSLCHPLLTLPFLVLALGPIHLFHTMSSSPSPSLYPFL